MNNPSSTREQISQNYLKVIERIHKAARNCGRNPEEVRLVVVTKTHPVEIVRLVIEAGAKDIGENYVEEAEPKIHALMDERDINWHMIGHIQSRKAEKVCEYFQFIHSVDSLKLAEKLNRYASIRSKPLPVWMEFNIGGEETKSGWDITRKEYWNDLLPEIEKIMCLPGLSCLGVMTVPPFSVNPEDSRPYYRQLREFRDHLVTNLNITGFSEFSMGMSSDFEVAIQEGSTCVRIGQAILGPRS